RCLFAAIALGLVSMLGIASPSQAYVYSNEGQWASWTSGSFTIYNDVWGNPNPSQWLNVNSTSNWNISTNQSGGGIKSYANESFSPNYPITNSSTVKVTFNCSTASGAAFDNSFDCWDNNGNEVMIWENWGGAVGPAGSEKYANVSIAGATWNVYQGNVGHNCVSFLRTSQRHSGTEYPDELMYWAKAKGLINGATLTQVQLGFEVTSTSGWQTFTMNSYSASW
ncbi:MAG TPA: hypothetical protein VFW40_08900, partial [Capsulimonadaceae bacterium]|nr:hypothetical protein [Capsulimonadaceae bacterium]